MKNIKLHCSIIVSSHFDRLAELVSGAGLDITFGFLWLIS
jgi:hypothetical protein